ncbi:MAG: hypothetical protein JSV92_04150 [archaeon]|nr:MAG: hypothetical protein JSV92_04150 [archaeon]
MIFLEAEDVNYTPEGTEGRTCADCANFSPDETDPEKGICFGHMVVASGSCNNFEKK